jgi:collagenase-like PrtC family protease
MIKTITKSTKTELLSRNSAFNSKTKETKVELLAPAGSLNSLKAAIAGGANAVYLGLDNFNARRFAKNFTLDNLDEAVRLCKSNNVKLFLTMNTLVRNSELEDFLKMLKSSYEKGIDAVIIQDPSLIKVIKESFPELKVHISTQAGVMNSAHANLFEDADRINLARELNKKNIESIKNSFNKEIEVFVHGALCACVSGSCLFSSLLGGRSGNRGKCAQPCRKLYNNSFLLSTKELCLIDHIPEIIKMKINSIKIEGRMRSPFYAYTTSSIYRKALDSFYNNNFKVTPEMKKQLENAFSREFTEGKFADKFIFNLKQASGQRDNREIDYSLKIKSKPIKIEKRESKPINLKVINKNSSEKQLIVRVYNEQEALIAEKYADIICLDLFNKDFLKIKKQLTKPLYAVTPRIMFDSDIKNIKEKIKELSPKGLVAGNLGIIQMNEEFNLPIILDYNSNCFNDNQLAYYQSLNAKVIMSPELALDQLMKFKNKDFIVFSHGKIRLMTLAHELAENKITDEKGFNFYIKKIPNGSEILNEKELGLFNKLREIIKSGINQLYIDTESNEDASLKDILELYGQILDGKTPDASKLQKHYTLGWSKLGVA